MKIIDAFPFFNELKLLDLRLNILDKYVDKFILVEATRSHQDKPKPLFYNENKHLFEKFNHKIEHVVVDDLPSHTYWSHETYQRDCIMKGLKDEHHPDDIIFISDLDEIWNPVTLLPHLSQLSDSHIYKWQSLICYFYFNLVASSNYWVQPMFLKYSLLKKLVDKGYSISIDILRNQENKTDIHNVILPDLNGWHFSYTESPTYKLQNFLHSEYSNLTEEYIKECIGKKINPFHKNEMNTIKNELQDSYLPPYVVSNKEQYKDLIL
jgi:beta-1,4-mannosyl-glycoprotein beta-1,4-N-acetylglucosaminyltransferase